jgi:hypothetical protein
MRTPGIYWFISTRSAAGDKILVHTSLSHEYVIRGLDPRICQEATDGRIKSGHDDYVSIARRSTVSGSPSSLKAWKSASALSAVSSIC